MIDGMIAGDPSQGVRMTIVLQRRIVNAILTIYLPTLLILCIVYATNFFKDFFFEAVVTVNLTALLVLTTLFISISGNLPPTAYIKMVDVWLIFAQAVPWLEVLLHTLTDMMRTEEGEAREINHHGKIVTVGGEQDGITKVLPSNTVSIESAMYGSDDDDDSSIVKVEEVANGKPSFGNMIDRNEEKLVEARKDFYERANANSSTVARLQFIGKLKTRRRSVKSFLFVTGRVVIPFVIVIFSILYWSYGLMHYFSDSSLPN